MTSTALAARRGPSAAASINSVLSVCRLCRVQAGDCVYTGAFAGGDESAARGAIGLRLLRGLSGGTAIILL